jgi:uncharacterized membrane protein
MSKGRLEAFSDGVIAILITIMVLELKVPQGVDLAALSGFFPILCTYVLSFVFLGIYWSNHHHLFQAVQRVDGRILWANLHLLFWLSLVPFATAWMGEHPAEPVPVAAYGVVLFLAGCAYYVLARGLVALHGRESTLARALGEDRKGLLSIVIYGAAIGLAYVRPSVSLALYVVVAVIWLVPDRRIERILTSASTSTPE